MATGLEAYKNFQLKLNKLDSGDNFDISKGEFVIIFNEQQVVWYQNRFRKKSSSFDINDVQAFVETDVKLTKVSTKNSRYTEFSIPTNYLDYIRSYSICDKGICKARIVRNFQVKLTAADIIVMDDDNSPSFEYQETPLTIAGDKLQVYKSDFTIVNTFLTYYRYPADIDIAGYKHISGKDSTNIDPELRDDYVNEIINLCVLDVQRSTENGEGFQLSNNRVDKQNNNN